MISITISNGLVIYLQLKREKNKTKKRKKTNPCEITKGAYVLLKGYTSNTCLKNEALSKSTINNETPIIRVDGVLGFTFILVNICVIVSENSKHILYLLS